MAAQLAVGYRHLLGVHMPKQCQKALLYYNPVAERVVAGAQRVKASQLIEKVRLTWLGLVRVRVTVTVTVTVTVRVG